MRHQIKKGRSLGRVKKVRKGLLKSLVVALIDNEKVKTTEAKGKELARYIAPLVTRARNNDVTSRRILSKKLPKESVKKLVDEIAPRYKDRPGGYTRIIRLGERRGDSAPMVIVEFV